MKWMSASVTALPKSSAACCANSAAMHRCCALPTSHRWRHWATITGMCSNSRARPAPTRTSCRWTAIHGYRKWRACSAAWKLPNQRSITRRKCWKKARWYKPPGNLLALFPLAFGLALKLQILLRLGLALQVGNHLAVIMAVGAIGEVHHDLLVHRLALAGLVGHQIEPGIRGEGVDQRRYPQHITHLVRGHAGLQLRQHVSGHEVALQNINAMKTGETQRAAAAQQRQQNEKRNQGLLHKYGNSPKCAAIIQT